VLDVDHESVLLPNLNPNTAMGGKRFTLVFVRS
jgi:hypothetical protein